MRIGRANTARRSRIAAESGHAAGCTRDAPTRVNIRSRTTSATAGRQSGMTGRPLSKRTVKCAAVTSG